MEQTESGMNGNPGQDIPTRQPAVADSDPCRSSAWRRRIAVAAVMICGYACGALAADASGERIYDVVYTVRPLPDSHSAEVEMAVSQTRGMLRQLSMDLPGDNFSGFHGDGEIAVEGKELHWSPPRDGGNLRWTVSINHQRDNATYDAWLDADWAVFRASDIIPPARTRALKGAQSRTYLQFDLPEQWSSLTQYAERAGRYRVQNPERRFDRPTGWILLGKIGVRIETIAGVRVLVGGPAGHAVRRLDLLALLHWTLPHLKGVLPDFPSRLTIISAGENMWRGGLSGPRSLFLHAELPLISENATSTLLHEILHLGTRFSAGPGADWIVEGFAEYYSLELLRRSRSISKKRFDTAIENLVEWGESAESLCTPQSTGATTARAVGIIAALHKELRRSGGDPLDDLLRNLVAADSKVSVTELRSLASEIHGSMPKALSARNLRGCKL
ncbi:hypothetical protein [Woeseia oceani]|nr:hypothetical protein [Woeseia oceani]